MSEERMEVVLHHEHPASAGMFAFDGTVVEIFGFGSNDSVRLHVRQIERVEVGWESGVFSTRFLRFVGCGGSNGWVQTIDPEEGDRPGLERFAEVVDQAASRQREK